MNESPSFVIKTDLEIDFDELLSRVPAALKEEGFGVLSEIDVKGTLENKLGVTFRRYRILGACRPESAHRVLNSDLDVGVLLPCNVVVYETDEGRSVLAAIDPMAAIAGLTPDPAIKEVAEDVRARLARVVEAIAGATES